MEVVLAGVGAIGKFEQAVVEVFVDEQGEGRVGVVGKVHSPPQNLQEPHLGPHLRGGHRHIPPRQAPHSGAWEIQGHTQLLLGHGDAPGGVDEGHKAGVEVAQAVHQMCPPAGQLVQPGEPTSPPKRTHR